MNGCGSVAFTVIGKPETQGSMTAFPFQKRDGTLGVSMTHKSKKLKPWRAQVAEEAR